MNICRWVGLSVAEIAIIYFGPFSQLVQSFMVQNGIGLSIIILGLLLSYFRVNDICGLI